MFSFILLDYLNKDYYSNGIREINLQLDLFPKPLMNFKLILRFGNK